MLDTKLFRPWLKTAKKAAAPECRKEDRVAVLAHAELIIGIKVLQCRIVDIAPHGCRLKLDGDEQLEVCIGELGILRLPNGASLPGILRWIRDDDVGLQLSKALNVQSIIEDNQIRMTTPRAGRAPVCLAIKVSNDDGVHAARLQNISATGALVSCDADLSEKSTVFLHSDLIRPIGGYVRWTNGKSAGIMFNRLLPVKSAEFIAGMHGVREFWLDEVKHMHQVQKAFQSDMAPTD